MQNQKMPDIKISVGLCTRFTINLSKVDFLGIEKIIFTVKNDAEVDSPVIIEREFTEAKVHTVTVTPEESIRLREGARYDLNKILEDGTRHSYGDPGAIVLRKSVGGCLG